MITFDDALALIHQAALPLGSETVPIGEARGRVLSETVFAAVASPPSDVSSMDGYAVREADLGAFPVRLRVVAESFAGAGVDRPVGAGECVRIFTGARLPAGADRVVVQEVVRRDGGFAVIDAHSGSDRHIRARGSDFTRGDRLVSAGRRLGYRELVAAAGGDHAQVAVWRRPRLVVLSTGDELVAPGLARTSREAIPESVSFGVVALAGAWGAQMVGHVRLSDDLGKMEPAAAAATEAADLVVVTGGASVGEKDFARRMFEPLGLELLFAKVAIKPGKPVWLGRARDTLVLGLPGNPTSAMVTARLLLAPLVTGLCGLDPREALKWRQMPLADPLGPCGDRETFVRARCADGAAVPLANQDSSAQSSLAEAGLLLRRRASSPALAAGELVEALDF